VVEHAFRLDRLWTQAFGLEVLLTRLAIMRYVSATREQAMPKSLDIETIALRQGGGPPPGDAQLSDGFGARKHWFCWHHNHRSHQPEDDEFEPGGGRGEAKPRGEAPVAVRPQVKRTSGGPPPKANRPLAQRRDDRTGLRTVGRSITGRGRDGTGGRVTIT